MPRTPVAVTLARRQQVESLEVRGQTPAAIALALGGDIRTIKRDLAWLALTRGAVLDVGAGRLRLLAAAQTIEAAAWQLYAKLPADDANGRLGALAKALQAHERQASLLGAIETATLAAELAELRAQVQALHAGEARETLRLVEGQDA